MNAAVDFPWPSALQAARRAAEEGTLSARPLYPLEVKALCNLVADAPLGTAPREIAPGMSVSARTESRKESEFREDRAAYYFIARFDNGRIWQCSMFTDWLWYGTPRSEKRRSLRPQNIVHAVTRSIAAEGSAR